MTYIIKIPGGRHYSDRLCSDRRYSDNPQSGRRSTSLARLGICRNSRNLQKTARIGSRRGMHRKRGIDRGTEVTEGSGVWGGYPCGVWGAPSSEKVTTYVPPTDYCTAPDFPHLVRRLSNRYCPWAYSTAVSHPTVDCRNSVCRNRVCWNSVVYPKFQRQQRSTTRNCEIGNVYIAISGCRSLSQSPR